MIDTNKFKKLIEEELVNLEKELQTVARKNPENKDDWQAVPTMLEENSADENEAADEIEEFGTNNAIAQQLEARYNELKDALTRIEAGTYGKDENTGKEISEERLLANPAARTNIKR